MKMKTKLGLILVVLLFATTAGSFAQKTEKAVTPIAAATTVPAK
jgi:hypothetical protein